jgi:hypothetical protein
MTKTIVYSSVKPRTFILSTTPLSGFSNELHEEALIIPQDGTEEVLHTQFALGKGDIEYKGAVYSNFSLRNIKAGQEYDATLVDNSKKYQVKISREDAGGVFSTIIKRDFYIKMT